MILELKKSNRSRVGLNGLNLLGNWSTNCPFPIKGQLRGVKTFSIFQNNCFLGKGKPFLGQSLIEFLIVTYHALNVQWLVNRLTKIPLRKACWCTFWCWRLETYKYVRDLTLEFNSLFFCLFGALNSSLANHYSTPYIYHSFSYIKSLYCVRLSILKSIYY